MTPMVKVVGPATVVAPGWNTYSHPGFPAAHVCPCYGDGTPMAPHILTSECGCAPTSGIRKLGGGAEGCLLAFYG
jgi:hypothetical protein